MAFYLRWFVFFFVAACIGMAVISASTDCETPGRASVAETARTAGTVMDPAHEGEGL